MATKKIASKKAAIPAKGTAAKKADAPIAKAASSSKTAGAAAGKGGKAKRISKSELVRSMAEKLEIPNRQLAGIFDLLAQTAVEETRSNGEFTIPGIGKLVRAERKARVGRNPQTGEAINIGAKTTVKFRVSKTVKDTISPPKK